MTVLELGAGIGDHTAFYLDRGCRVTATDARPANLDYLRRRYPGLDVRRLDLDDPEPLSGGPFDVVHAYGLLYHLGKPAEALAFMASQCRRYLFLETCVSFGPEEAIHPVRENRLIPFLSSSGGGCRPTRLWVFNRLKELFEYVYIPVTQPDHEEFPLDWGSPRSRRGLVRSVFVASRRPLGGPLFTAELPLRQTALKSLA